MKTQIMTMLEMQDAMNARVHADWRDRNQEWYRAIWVECAELMDHFGWKWWKKQDPDREQVVLELVDIWHFGLSIVLTDHSDLEQGAALVEQGLDLNAATGSFREDVEAFALKTLQTKAFDIPGFAKLMLGMDLSFDDLYRRYVGKNVLNFFRQDHGYKEGTYHKIWQGKEDNEHLVEVLEQLDASSEGFKDDLYAALASRYPQD